MASVEHEARAPALKGPKAFDPGEPQFADVYDELPLWSSLAGNLVFDELEVRAGERVLDIGCGTGYLALELAQRIGGTGHVTGIDIWPRAIERARSKAEYWGVDNVVFHCRDAIDPGLPEGSIDLAVSSLGINNFADPTAALAATRRATRDGARLVLATNVQGHMAELYEALAPLLDGEERTELAAHVQTRVTLEGLEKMLTTAGFDPRRSVKRQHVWHFASGTALLDHSLVRIAFLPAWLESVKSARRSEVLTSLAQALDRAGGIKVTLPFVYVEACAV